ncbi:hypothetical protein [Nocardioides sp. B-3]|uniref:hypothetical protein n=1 Tax=Nocardioides sp. B-3 TaxID=2895565 RepID=UPI0021530AED|nr:hypothetical protein [Nocardioides sp. B-3]UUZ60945.1 hypothetical protein LP418_09740 [Nocardioides sp. B-3]
MTSHEPAASVTAVVRPRRHGWGDATARRAMSGIAEALRHLVGYEVCAIEVLRSDAMLEFVALATEDATTRSEMDGVSSPLSAMYPALDRGLEVGVLRFVRAEDMTPEAFDRLRPYSVVPDTDPSDDATRWRAEDMLVAHVRDAQGRLRALVYFDLPYGGRRPDPVQLADLETLIRPGLHSILVQIEREEFAQRIRLAHGTARSSGRLPRRATCASCSAPSAPGAASPSGRRRCGSTRSRSSTPSRSSPSTCRDPRSGRTCARP